MEVLKKQLEEKDCQLTDLRLEALTSAHQLDVVKEELRRYKSEINDLRMNNERLKSGTSGSGRTSSAFRPNVGGAGDPAEGMSCFKFQCFSSFRIEMMKEILQREFGCSW